jgi:hypothetical protein
LEFQAVLSQALGTWIFFQQKIKKLFFGIGIFLGSSGIRVGAFLTKTGKKDPWIAAF